MTLMTQRNKFPRNKYPFFMTLQGKKIKYLRGEEWVREKD